MLLVGAGFYPRDLTPRVLATQLASRVMAPEPIRYLDPDGVPRGGELPALSDLTAWYEAMVTVRVYDRKCSAMQRQGRLATYAPFEGQEAAQIGAVAALRPDDWLVATYRDAGAMWFQGYPMVNLFLGRIGDERGGRSPDGVNVLPPSITVGAHMIHAVGIGWGERLQGRDRIALTMFGDGATSEGDFHEAMNFAGVYRTPTVFFCQNNGWAISMPRERQTASETIAAKAIAYGMPGTLVDGNDVVAVHAVTAEAVARARNGGGPTLIEAVTYRMGPHTTTDDPSRYQADGAALEWRARDPLDRVRRYLETVGAWSDRQQTDTEEGASVQVEAAVDAAEAVEAPTAEDVFAAMFAEPTAALEVQRGMLDRDRS